MEQKSWIVSVNMGYGHQRTAFTLKDLAFGGQIINANNYQGIPEKDRRVWESVRIFYEFISNFKKVPIIGEFIFFIFDQIQKIHPFNLKKDLSKPSFQLKQNYSLIKKGWGEHLIKELRIKNKESGANLPIVTTFFTPAFMAEYFNYPGEIFCVVCDADIARHWASINPTRSKIKYFAPTERVVERLKLYGVKSENIYLTGFPLPKEFIGVVEILKEDLKHRILNLDPQKRYFEKYKTLIEENFGELPEKFDHPLTILFSVGGAGTQKEIGLKIIKSLAGKIKKGEVKVILSAGVKEKVKEYFEKKIKGLKLEVEILFKKDIEDYFREFNKILRKTDILWTKPSELSFYSALGLPIIVASAVGSQEEFNKSWLLKSGFGILQENPDYTAGWLFDWLNNGYLAEAAMQGFIKSEKFGTLNIQKIISKCCG
jgi:hypothetical protein